jgi:hypothetical protein
MKLRHFLKTVNDHTLRYPLVHLFPDPGVLVKAKQIVPFFYYFSLFQAMSLVSARRFESLPQAQFSPVWSLGWTSWIAYPNIIVTLDIFFLFAAVAAVFWYRHRVARLLVFLAIFQADGFLSSFGQPNHYWLPWLWISFFFIFFPDIWGKTECSPSEKKKFLIVILGAQASVFLIYSLAGFWKLLRALEQFSAGAANALSPDALALHIAARQVDTGITSIFGPLFIHYPLLGWPLFLGMIYVEFFALWVVFRPSLHKVWGGALIVFHIGTFFTLGLTFLNTIFFISLLFLSSPFSIHKTTIREMIFDLPIFGWVARSASSFFR